MSVVYSKKPIQSKDLHRVWTKYYPDTTAASTSSSIGSSGSTDKKDRRSCDGTQHPILKDLADALKVLRGHCYVLLSLSLLIAIKQY
jgi:hypothetical protein